MRWPGCGITVVDGSSTVRLHTIRRCSPIRGCWSFISLQSSLPSATCRFPTTPSSRLAPAVQAQEKLGWRLGVSPYSFHKFTLFEALDKTAELGLSYIGGLSFQKISPELNEDLAPPLTDSELQQIRLKMDSAGVRMLTYYMHHIPGDEQGCRQVFDFARKLGIETLISEPLPETLDMIERFCD